MTQNELEMLLMTLGMVSPVLICHSWMVTNGIFWNNLVLLCPFPFCLIPFCPIHLLWNGNIAHACQCTSVTSFKAQALEALQSHKKFFRRNKLSFERRSLRKKYAPFFNPILDTYEVIIGQWNKTFFHHFLCRRK